MTLDLRRLRMLRELARRGTIAGAASSLGYTPSAVSQQLAKLEREVGVSLPERGPRSVELTEAGRRLAEHAEAVLTRLTEAEDEIRALAGVGRLRLASFATAGVALVPDAVARLRRRHPAVEVTLRQLDPIASLEQLGDRELDLALVAGYDFVPLPERRGIMRALLFEEPLQVMLPSGHPLAAKRSVALAELAGEPWIRSARGSFCHPFTARACRAAGFEPRIVAEVDDYRAMERLVASGSGVAFVPELLAGHLAADVAVRLIAFRPPRRRVFAAWSEGSEPIPVVRAAIEVLVEAARGRGEPLPRQAAGERA